MTDEDLKRLEELANAATPGPWYAHNPDDDYCMNVFVVTTSKAEPDVGVDERKNDHGEVVALTLFQAPRVADHASMRWEADADFIAVAREAVPALIAEVRRLHSTLSWRCAGCGAAFPMAPGMGLAAAKGDETRCFRCVQIEELAAEIRRLHALLKAADSRQIQTPADLSPPVSPPAP